MKQIYWACVDLKGTYMPELHAERRAAEKDRREQSHLTDAKFVVSRVRLVRVMAK